MVGADKVKSEDSTVLLGMKVSGNLKWDHHVKDLKAKLRQRLGLLRRLSHSLPKYALRQVAEGIFTSKLRYGIAVYCKPKLTDEDNSNRILRELTILQNEMIRIITRCRDRRKNMGDLRKKTRSLTVNQLCCYHILIETYSILCYKSSGFMFEKWTTKPGAQRLTRSEEQNNIVVPVNNTCKNSILYYGAKLWNMLPDKVKRANQEENIDPDSAARALTEKELCLLQRQREKKCAEVFKKFIRKWIQENIPAI